jgi:hypothetical protein
MAHFASASLAFVLIAARRRRTVLAACVSAAMLVCGCSDMHKQELDVGFGYAKKTLARAGQDPFTARKLGDNEQQGGNAVNYILASVPRSARFRSFEVDLPTHPWTVVVKYGPGEREFTLEAYAETLENPVRVETVTLAELPRK